MPETTETQPVLCFIKDGIAYFTTLPLSEQTGPNWDKRPYEKYAGAPYGPPSGNPEAWTITRLAYSGPLVTPAEFRPGGSEVSVDFINGGRYFWLISTDDSPRYASVEAGVSPDDFQRRVLSVGGKTEVAV